MLLPHSSLIISALISLSVPHCLANEHAHEPGYEPAWNGYTPPGTGTPAHLTPYFVPDGAVSYDSSSPFVHYKGKWVDSYSPRFVGGSSRKTTVRGASFSLYFTGTGIEWFGSTGPKYGEAEVYLDGQLTQRVDVRAAHKHFQQRLYWQFGLTNEKHSLTVVHVAPEGDHGRYTVIDVDALVVYKALGPTKHGARPPPYSHELVAAGSSQAAQVAGTPLPGWELVQKGSTGVAAMQLAIVSSTHAIIIDKVEHNPLTVNHHPAWGALYNFETHTLTALDMKSNSFCAGGAFISNGTLVNTGGNGIYGDNAGTAYFGQTNGPQAVRLLEPCEASNAANCGIYEDQEHIRLASPRWYSTSVRIQDGSVMIVGGSKRGGWMNNATTNNPTIEYFPPKNIHGANGTPVHVQFLVDTLNSNLFPIAFLLPDGRIFLAANRDATIYDWKKNTEEQLPRIPNGVRVTYPMTGTGVLLPLTPENDYAPEVLICGGSTLDDTKESHGFSAKDPASDQCARLLLTPEGIKSGWQVEHMPRPRIMPDAVLLPTGAVVIINGAGSGISGYKNVRDQVGMSNADNPVRAAVLYEPAAPAGRRFSQGLPESVIPRMYHSTATATPNGDIMIAGSNPNLDRSEVAYGTEYRAEWLRPPYMGGQRPEIVDAPRIMNFREQVKVRVKIPENLHGKPIKGEFYLCSLRWQQQGVVLTQDSSSCNGLWVRDTRSTCQLTPCISCGEARG